MEHKTLIQAHDLVIGYRHHTVLSGLDFSLAEGELTCLMGFNGAGKSTLIKTLCGMIPAVSGQFETHGRIGVVLTEKGNAGGLTVYELVSLGRYRHTDFFGSLKESDHKAIKAALSAVGMDRKSDKYVSQISDGERQKAFIAKALAQECPIIILDEPTAFLDVTSRVEMMVLLRRLAHEEGRRYSYQLMNLTMRSATLTPSGFFRKKRE